MSISQKDLINSDLNNLVLQINKKFARCEPILNQRLKDKFDCIFRIINDSDKPVTKEMIFLILWSTLNEFSGAFVRNRTKSKLLLDLDTIRHEKQGRQYSPNYRKLHYSLEPSKFRCITYWEDIKPNDQIDLFKLSFYIQVFLRQQHNEEELLLLFNYLCQLRNKLFLVHGNEKGEELSKGSTKSDFVTIEDCNWMILFLHKLFSLPIRNSITNRIFENTIPERNKHFCAAGKLIHKFTNKFERLDYYFVVELLDFSGLPITRTVLVSEKIFYANEIGGSFTDGVNQSTIKEKLTKPIEKVYYKFILESSASNKSYKSIFTVTSEDYERIKIDDYLRIKFHIETNKMRTNLVANSVVLIPSKPEFNSTITIVCRINKKQDFGEKDTYRFKVVTKKDDKCYLERWIVISKELYEKYNIGDKFNDQDQEIVDKLPEKTQVTLYSFIVEYTNDSSTQKAIINVKSKSEFESCSEGETIKAEIEMDSNGQENILTLTNFTKLVRGPLMNNGQSQNTTEMK